MNATQVLNLIAKIKKLPILYCLKPSISDEERDKAWTNLSKDVGFDAESIKLKWEEILIDYKRYLINERDVGGKRLHLSRNTWYLAGKLTFLRKHMHESTRVLKCRDCIPLRRTKVRNKLVYFKTDDDKSKKVFSEIDAKMHSIIDSWSENSNTEADSKVQLQEAREEHGETTIRTEFEDCPTPVEGYITNDLMFIRDQVNTLLTPDIPIIIASSTNHPPNVDKSHALATSEMDSVSCDALSYTKKRKLSHDAMTKNDTQVTGVDADLIGAALPTGTKTIARSVIRISADDYDFPASKPICEPSSAEVMSEFAVNHVATASNSNQLQIQINGVPSINMNFFQSLMPDIKQLSGQKLRKLKQSFLISLNSLLDEEE